MSQTPSLKKSSTTLRVHTEWENSSNPSLSDHTEGAHTPRHRFVDNGSPSRLRSPKGTTPRTESFKAKLRSGFEGVSLDKLDEIVGEEKVKMESVDKRQTVQWEDSNFKEAPPSLRKMMFMARFRGSTVKSNQT
mmetsp:Transcript_12466/g.31486  ORF Transcript_12466/g.31486 Transcript_12466/m.31486 type:complete len:134 (+) Transcript_12466:135-536(+)|eukprot:CAMPEP_0184720124 /NCGR_PEP_ID=MMETSP0314-20130426/10509_1 /TAXON_ID=38298 /ORGANISM="Rhodella maculata, Strain CCMP 736" /LENGTH=133 /DNA_ID=CAMNT_0027184127 /DNA_START=16 /DNA_END=417 /DNA_ORIENTATION=-